MTFKLLRNRCDKLIDDCLSKFRSAAPSHIRKSPKYFWTFINSLRSNSNEIPDEMFLNENTVSGGQQISDLFSKHFQSIYKISNSSSVSLPPNSNNCHTTLHNVFLSKAEILKSLKLININKGPGPDAIPPVFLRTCAKQLVEPLFFIYNKSLMSGTFPTKWKAAHVTPIFKSGDRSDIINYRPISLLSSLGKLFESLVHKYIYFHLKNIFDPQQHGFLPGRSTTSNLLGYTNDIIKAIEQKKEVHAIYTDFSKAFDLVDHNLLVIKLGHAGICGSLLRWCDSYLRNRSQLVLVRGFKSRGQIIPSGVPQGSHLGPLFFLIFIHDLCSKITSSYKLYADDLKIYKTITSKDDVRILQIDLDNVNKWCNDNLMLLNPLKCQHIKFTRKKRPAQAIYSINGTNVNEVCVIRDLGVILDQRLDFREHFEHIIRKGGKLAGFVLRQTKVFKQPEIPILLFNCYVRSLLEYCSPVWNPFYKIHIDRIEGIQRKFFYHLTFANNKCKMLQTYDARLEYYKSFPLSSRRKAADLIFLFKIINGMIDSPDILDKIALVVPRPASRPINRKSLVVTKSRTNYGCNAPVDRLCRTYNDICQELDIFNTTVASIKSFVLD